MRSCCTSRLALLALCSHCADCRQARNGDGTVPAAKHSLRACGGAMARRRGQFCDLGYPVTKMLKHTSWRWRSADFRLSRNGDGVAAAKISLKII